MALSVMPRLSLKARYALCKYKVGRIRDLEFTQLQMKTHRKNVAEFLESDEARGYAFYAERTYCFSCEKTAILFKLRFG